MKSKLSCLFPIILFLSSKGHSQYKDLEGIFFGKVVSVGPSVSYRSFGDEALDGTIAISPINYNVHFNAKTSMWMRFSLPKKMSVVSEWGVGVNSYSRQDDFKLWEYEFGYRFAVTKGGTDKPTSVFVNLNAGYLTGKHTTYDSRWGISEAEEVTSQLLVGGGLTIFQRLGQRILLFAEPVYKYNLSMGHSKIFLDDMYERQLKFSHINAQFGILYLVGRKG